MAGAVLAAMSRKRHASNGGAQAPALPRRPNNGGAAAPSSGGSWAPRQGLANRIFNAGAHQNSIVPGSAPAGPAPSGPGGAPPVKAPGAQGPTAPPPGYYDPTIDSQVRASQRGLGDLLGDNQTARDRGFTDYTLSGQDITNNRDQQLADARTGFDRGSADSMLNEGRMNADYGTALTNLQRGYTRLGGNQGQAISSAGMGSGGAFAQAAAKRADNMAIDRAPIDTGHDRGIADLLTQRARMGEDYTTGTGRISSAADRALGQLNLGYQRQGQDLGTSDQRAQREATAFGQDANSQRWFQAQQAGYSGPIPGGSAPAAVGVPAARHSSGGAPAPHGLASRIFAAGRAQQRRRGR